MWSPHFLNIHPSHQQSVSISSTIVWKSFFRFHLKLLLIDVHFLNFEMRTIISISFIHIICYSMQFSSLFHFWEVIAFQVHLTPARHFPVELHIAGLILESSRDSQNQKRAHKGAHFFPFVFEVRILRARAFNSSRMVIFFRPVIALEFCLVAVEAIL